MGRRQDLHVASHGIQHNVLLAPASTSEPEAPAWQCSGLCHLHQGTAYRGCCGTCGWLCRKDLWGLSLSEALSWRGVGGTGT